MLEQQTAWSENQYLTEILGAMNLDIFGVDSESTVRLWNAGMSAKFLPENEAVGARFDDIFLLNTKERDSVRQLTDAVKKQVIGNGEKVVLRGLNFTGINSQHDQERYNITAFPLKDGDNKIYGALAVFQDLTAELKYKEALEAILENSADGIFVMDNDRSVLIFNPACEEITGWSVSEILGKQQKCYEVTHCHLADGESLAGDLCPKHALFEGNQRVAKEMIFTTKSGRDRWVEATYSPVRNQNDEIRFIICILRDIDERKRMEEELFQNRKLASLGEMAAGLAHELRNPLGIILSSAEIVANPERPDEQRRLAAEYIQSEAKRLDKRIHDFLLFAKPKVVSKEETDIHHVLEATIESFLSSANERDTIKIEKDFAGELQKISADAEQLRQVFHNLITNAAQACGPEGVLKISTFVLGENINVTFSDNGPGIPDEVRERIYDPFYTTKEDGTGLGLAIVHEIVRGHGGRMNFETSEKGSSFMLSFPVNLGGGQII